MSGCRRANSAKFSRLSFSRPVNSSTSPRTLPSRATGLSTSCGVVPSLSPAGDVAIVVVWNGRRQAEELVGEQTGLARQLTVRAHVVEGIVVVDGVCRQNAECFRHVLDAEGGEEALLPIERLLDVDDRELLPRVNAFIPNDRVVENLGIVVVLGLSRLDLHAVLRAFPSDAVLVFVFEVVPPARLMRENALVAPIPLAGVGIDAALGFVLEGEYTVLRIALDAVVADVEERRHAGVAQVVEGADVPATAGDVAFQAVRIEAIVILIGDGPLLPAQPCELQETEG